MEHHEIIAEMLKNRRNNVETKKELKYPPKKSIKKHPKVSKEETKTVEVKKENIIEEVKIDVVDNRTPKEIERERRILARLEKSLKCLKDVLFVEVI